MQIRSKDAESLFAAAYGLGPRHAVAFRRRLEHLRTYGCPMGLNTGRGRPAMYGWVQLVQQTFALDLVDLGLTPERAALLTIGNPHAAHFHSRVLVLEPVTLQQAKRWVGKSKWPISESLFLMANFRELANLGGTEHLSFAVHAVHGRELAAWNTERNELETSYIAVDFGLMISRLIQRVAIWTKGTIAETTTSFFEWAEEYDVYS